MVFTDIECVKDFSGDIFNHMRSDLRDKIKCTKGFVMLCNNDVVLLWDSDGSLHNKEKFNSTEFTPINGDDAFESVDYEYIKDKYIVIVMEGREWFI